MKKFLQKTLAILAMCLVSMGAMAQDVIKELDFSNSLDGGTYTSCQSSDGVVSAVFYAYSYGANVCDGWNMTISAVGANIIRIEFPTSTNSSLNAMTATGYTGSTGIWTGSASSVTFTSTSWNGAYLYNARVYLDKDPAAGSTFFFTSAYPAGGKLTEAMTAGINVYHNNGTLSFADGKTCADITVNGSAVPYVQNYEDQLWISYNVTEEGTFVLTIPEGTFVDNAGKTNEEFTQTYTLEIPGVAMTAGWATYCDMSSWIVPAGYKGYVVSDIVDGSAVLTEFYNSGAIVNAYVSVILNGPVANKVAIEKTYGNSDNPSTNYLMSTVNIGETEASIFNVAAAQYYGMLDSDGGYLYKLSFDSEGENLGFYWDSENGQSINCQPNKAFLMAPASKVSASNGLKIRIADHTTGINGISTEGSNVIYNLQGQRVNTPTAGVYVKNGKKFIVK